MTIVSSSARRDLAFWLMWLVVVFTLLMAPWQAARPIAPGVAMPEHWEMWRSAFDPIPWPGRSWCTRWYLAVGRFSGWLATWRGRLVLAVRLCSCRSLAEIISALTRRQVSHYLGALPVLVTLLERLGVRQIINHYCPTQSPVDHGAVAVVLVLNRLIAPRPLYKVMDWLASTLISDYLGIPASRFNDDRLGRTLDALAEHAQAIWQDIASQALRSYRIDLSVMFYDLTALVMTGDYPDSALVDYGFAHNTPSDDPKIKIGLSASRDGGIPSLFMPWSGRTADKATVLANMQALRRFLASQGWDTRQVLVVGDSANLNSELALAYEDAPLKYLAGLPKVEKEHRALLLAPNEADFARLPLTDDGYWGVPCAVTFTHNGRSVTHRGLVVLSGPMRTALRQTRKRQFRELFVALHHIQGKIGQKRYRTEHDLRQRVATQLCHSPVAELVGVEVYTTPQGQPALRWWVDANALQAAQRPDGRYLLVTNDPHLSYPQMLALYRDKDQVEKRFEVAKQHLKIRPLFVHSDERIRAMLLVNLLALLTYSLLERQAQQHGLCLTTQAILERLSSLQVHQVEAWDGSQVRTLGDCTPQQAQLLTTLLQAVTQPLKRTPLPRHPATHPLEVWLLPALTSDKHPPCP